MIVSSGFKLASVNQDAHPGFKGRKRQAEKLLAEQNEELSELQERLYASATGEATDAVLLVLQGMDTAGKGGIVRNVIGAVDPQGVKLAAFKKPTKEELAHDFLWRIEKQVPGAGQIGVFDRSHYEDVLIQRVRSFASAEEIERRYGAINDFEERLNAQGIRVLKVMLHISKGEQKARLLERLHRPDKYWKYNPGDVDERLLWDDYMDAYQIMLERTSTEENPWFVVPANGKDYARVAVQSLLLNTLRKINPEWPPASFDVDAEIRRLENS
ncbi:MAG: polyphosphate kinase 2 family protein [Microbacteriaceae bacterium]|nr:polyphosphate kinase 2 family protein [Microbacteriaceae bacterium]